jgi:hypothetical protein
MSYFHLGEEAHVEMEVTYHSLALSHPHCSAEEARSCTVMAIALDPDAYLRACDDVIYLHWRTEQPVAKAVS